MRSISVIIPTRNRPVYLERAVKSVLAGLASNDELIVIDDGSNIHAQDVLGSYAGAQVHINRLGSDLRGPAAARNLGISQAVGDIVAFLDDDDEMLPHYLCYIREIASPKADFGFSCYLQSDDQNAGLLRQAKVRFPEGAINPDAAVRKQAFGFGMGFWMSRQTAEMMGPLDASLLINEDTEYFCRLARARRRGWYSAQPGVTVYTHAGHQDSNITKRATSDERARCMFELCQRYPEHIDHLGKGYIRHCLRSGRVEKAFAFVQSQSQLSTRLRLQAYLRLKWLGYRFTGIRP